MSDLLSLLKEFVRDLAGFAANWIGNARRVRFVLRNPKMVLEGRHAARFVVQAEITNPQSRPVTISYLGFTDSHGFRFEVQWADQGSLRQPLLSELLTTSVEGSKGFTPILVPPGGFKGVELRWPVPIDYPPPRVLVIAGSLWPEEVWIPLPETADGYPVIAHLPNALCRRPQVTLARTGRGAKPSRTGAYEGKPRRPKGDVDVPRQAEVAHSTVMLRAFLLCADVVPSSVGTVDLLSVAVGGFVYRIGEPPPKLFWVIDTAERASGRQEWRIQIIGPKGEVVLDQDASFEVYGHIPGTNSGYGPLPVERLQEPGDYQLRAELNGCTAAFHTFRVETASAK